MEAVQITTNFTAKLPSIKKPEKIFTTENTLYSYFSTRERYAVKVLQNLGKSFNDAVWKVQGGF